MNGSSLHWSLPSTVVRAGIAPICPCSFTCRGASCWIWAMRGLCQSPEREGSRSKTRLTSFWLFSRQATVGRAVSSTCNHGLCEDPFPQPEPFPGSGWPPPQAADSSCGCYGFVLPSSLPGHQEEWTIPCWDPFQYILFIPSCLRQSSSIGKGEKYE